MDRREFLKSGALSALMPFMNGCQKSVRQIPGRKPNIVFVFGDQWRAQATGYSGDPNLQGKTPNLDKLASESINLSNAVSTCPVCTPYRASLLTGQYALTHGLFLNDVPLRNEVISIAEVCKEAGYDTAYVGKWHVNAGGRRSYIPKERRQGFDYWKVLECTHNYNNSFYYAGDDPVKRKWKGYDAVAQTRDVQKYIKAHAENNRPFLIMLSWGPPHNPYGTAPEKYRQMFKARDIQLRPNVPLSKSKAAKKDLAGYYAHIAALDCCVGDIIKTINQTGIKENTIVVFTSDHGDMLGSQGYQRKQKPWDESVRVPLLIRYPARLGANGKEIDMPFGTPDIMATLLGLCDIRIPGTVQGENYCSVLTGQRKADNDAVLIKCPSPFGEWERRTGGKEYRGIRTRRYTYVRDLDGPWLLFDNEKDPYQQTNLVNSSKAASLQKKLDKKLTVKLKKLGDEFKHGSEYIKKWGYKADDYGTISYQG